MMRLLIVPFALLLLLAGSTIQAEDKALTEKQKIEALIKHVEEMKDTKFVRNGTEHDAKTAAKFLRGKWEDKAKEIKTAQDFIEKAASVSSTSGKAYMIRFKDGKEMKSSEYFLAELKKLEKPSKGRRQPSKD